MPKITLSLPRKYSKSRRSQFTNSQGLDKLVDLLKHRSSDDGSEDETTDSDQSSAPGLFGRSRNEVYTIGNNIFFKGGVNKENIDSLVKIIHRKNLSFLKKKRALKGEVNSSLHFCKITPNPLLLRISSHGGSLFDCLIAIDAIKNSKLPIYTVVEGYAASAATLISIVGHKRFITKNSYMLIHQLSSQFGGKYEEQKDDFHNSTQLMTHMKQLYLEHTKLTLEQLEDMLKSDVWCKSDECLDLGLVDVIQ